MVARLPLPAEGYVIYWCPETPGLGVRVSKTGDRAYIAQRRVDGKTVRRTLGKAAGAAAISAEAARRLQLDVSSELQQGKDRLQEKRERAEKEKAEGVTLDEAVRDYVAKKRRGKDGKPLKDRTKADYLAMLEPGGTTKSGKPLQDGELYALGSRALVKITGDDMRELYGSLSKRSQRRAVYAMQVLRAVFNWHGVNVPDNPLSKAVAGRDRIVLPQTKGKPTPIPPERLGDWWRAALKAGSDEVGGSALGGDACRFMVLTGCRPGEVFGSEHVEGVRVRDVDLKGGRMVLHDTKNRGDHTVMLSRQALEIATERAKGKKPAALLFPIEDVGKSLAAINKAAGVVGVSPHNLRSTFASIAEELVSAYTVKRMVNHTDTGDVTGTHYIGKSEAQLRAGWQAVADFIEAEAQKGAEQL
jgi:integrase